MANVNIIQSATIQDGLTLRKSTAVYQAIVDTTTLAQLVAAQGTWLTDLDAIIDGAIVDNSVTLKPAPPGGIKTVGTGAAFLAGRNATTGIYRFSATGSSKHWSSAIPSFAVALTVGDAMNTGATAVTDYSTLLTTGGYTNPENQDLLALTKTEITTRRK